MAIFYLTIPFMILAVSIAVVPLLWAMKHHEKWENASQAEVMFFEREEELIAA